MTLIISLSTIILNEEISLLYKIEHNNFNITLSIPAFQIGLVFI